MSQANAETTIHLDAITPALIEQAAQDNDINCAVRLLQDAAGITTGDVAGIAFSGDRDEVWWPTASVADRAQALRDYVKVEALYLER
ncbi:hypothetical protein LA345_12665 [Burkholderia vietnamiensis]|uniref:Uncharacterized protein n=1 Tax=Burkholderia vietnamiensis (strain G4 / LMG 22486) TaxID=269482 RepID=A4JFF3_BURVG|nr:hypothetical protein Bcep1808_2003 [Burkholderia vietnamiensis G4]MCB4344764.1 hypothetical protein [Burkholderia vietnamiensis]